MPTYLNKNFQQEEQNQSICRKVFDHIQICPVCQQAVKNTCFTMDKQTPSKSFYIEFNTTSVILLILLIIILLYISFYKK
jgi:hypothetical protein